MVVFCVLRTAGSSFETLHCKHQQQQYAGRRDQFWPHDDLQPGGDRLGALGPHHRRHHVHASRYIPIILFTKLVKLCRLRCA